MNQKHVIAQVKELNLPLGQYVILGGGALAGRRIRETKDLDVLVTQDLFEKLSKTYPLDSEYEHKWKRKRLKLNNVEIYPDLYLENANLFFDVEEVIKNAEIVEGLPLQPIDNLIKCKLDSGREKDLYDVELIKQFLSR